MKKGNPLFRNLKPGINHLYLEMKIFTYNESLDNQQKKILSRIRQLMNGDTAHQLLVSGMDYKKAYGVSLVHLRQLSKQYEQDNELAQRLWFRNVRETMILATMLNQPDALTDNQILEWADQINNIELAEQVAFNMLGRRRAICEVVEKWIFHPEVFVRYTALMAIGWHFRFIGNDLTKLVADNLATLDALATDKMMIRAVVHCLKMAGRFNSELSASISDLALKWCKTDIVLLQRAGQDVLDEIRI